MTAYGFDLDGTLTRPGLTQLANDLFAAGHKVYVITGGLNEDPPWDLVSRIAYLSHLHVAYTEIVRCIAPTWEEIAVLKGKACVDRDVTVMLDDMPVFLAGVQQNSPATVGLLVL